jgi:hypothetical protein
MLLGQYTYSHLSPEQQEAVRERDVRFHRESGSSFATIYRRMPSRFFGSYIVVMRSLGIPPALANESWDVPAGVELTPAGRTRLFNYLFQLLRDWRFTDPATEDARRDLIALGADIPPLDAVDLNEVHHLTRDGQVVTWKEWMRQQWPAE